MARSPQDEIAADLVWRFVERLREEEARGERVKFSRPELEELLETLDVASQLPQVLEAPKSDTRQAVVRARLEALFAEKAAAKPSVANGGAEGLPGRLINRWWLVPIPRWAAAGSLAAGMTLAAGLGFLGFRSFSGFGQGPNPSPWKRPPGINAVAEDQAREWIPLLVHSELPSNDERDLMWHMTVCRRCFDRYYQLQHDGRTAEETRASLLRMVRR